VRCATYLAQGARKRDPHSTTAGNRANVGLTRDGEKLDAVPPVKTLFLVQDVGEQEHDRLAACRLYCSPLFKKARAFVRAQGSDWFILSTKYGLIAPNKLITHYDKHPGKMSKDEREIWSNQIVQELRPHCTPGDSIVILAGVKYWEFLLHALPDFHVEVPMKGLRIGEMLHWLTNPPARWIPPPKPRSKSRTAMRQPEPTPTSPAPDLLDSLELTEEVRTLAKEARSFVEESPGASVRSARAALIAVVRNMGARRTLDQGIRDLEDSGKISEVAAIECKRRSKNPSLKRPVSPVAPE
jgi:hypothetical protein